MKKSIYLFRYFLIGFFFLTITPTCFAQTSTKKDTLAKYTYDELSEKFYAAKPDSLKAVNYAKYYINKAKRERDTLQQADGNYYLSDITKDSIYFVNYWNEIIEKIASKNKMYPSVSFLELGDYYLHIGLTKVALSKYLKASIHLNKNDSLKYIIKQRLGILKYKNGEIENSITLFKEAYNYYKKENSLSNYNNINHNLFINLASSFSKVKKYDSAVFYNKKASLIALKLRDSSMLGYSLYRSGVLEYYKNNYEISIKKLKKSIPYIINNENYMVNSQLYYYIAKSYIALNLNSFASDFYIKIDSLQKTKGILHISQKPAYKFLANYYKKENNITKQLEYINKYIKVDSVLNIRSKSVNKSLTENYDIPILLAEKKLIENRLKGDLSTTKNWVFGTGALAFLLSFFLIHQTRKRKAYKKRFEELMKVSGQVDIAKEETMAKKENTIPKETIENVLALLQQFEKNHDYIASEITLSSLAKTFETNSKYLSQLINQYKGKSFNNYVNELRITYAIEKLKTDLTFRKYSIKAIAYEVGFNTTESFSKAFFKNTGIRPSFFIKELEKK